jgi:hypothetical protein
MDDFNRNKLILLCSILICFAAAWMTQSSLMFNSDASWLMLATKRWLIGGNYTHDFFEINPPMILYIYTPAVYLSQLLDLPAAMALRLYVFTLIAVSLWLCAILTQKIFHDNDEQVRRNLLTGLAAVLLFLPVTEFGQREQLIVICTMPYFLLMAYRLQPDAQLNKGLALVTGLLAGLGFVIKPFFLAPLLFVEIFYFSQARQLRRLLRPELAGIACVFLFFIALLLIFNRDYITTVLPLITQFYYQKYRLPLAAMLLSEQAVFAYSALAFYVIRYRYTPYKMLHTVLMLLVCGFLLVYIMQQTPWYYHLLPLLMTSSLLYVVLFSLLITQQKFCRAEIYSLCLFVLALFSYLTIHMSYVSASLYYFPAAFFSLFAALGVMILLAASGNFLQAILLTTLVILAGMGFYQYLLHSTLQKHIFSLTTVLMILLYSLAIPKKLNAEKLRFMQFTILGAVIFTVPFYQGGYVYNYSQDYKKLYGNLLTVLREFPRQSIFFFSNIADFGFPALDYTQQTLASRFSGLGWVPGLPFGADQQSYSNAYQSQRSHNNFFLHAVVEDFEKYKPDVVLVDLRNTNADGVKRYFGNQQMDYIKFFSMDMAFKTTWQHYHFLKTVDGQPLFKFNIYVRNPSV